MKGYKMFDADWKCSGTNNGKKYEFQYRVGETYTHQGEISMCNAGFHFCKELQQCFNFYEAATWNHIAEVEALGEIIEGENKCVTNQMYRDWETDRKSTRLNSSHRSLSRMPSSA